MSHSDESIRQLTETVNTLATIVAKNESRYRSIEKTFRWTVVAFLCLTLVVFSVGFNVISSVQAQSTGNELLKQVIHFFQEFHKTEEEAPQLLKDVGMLIHNGAVLSERVKQDSDMLRQMFGQDSGTGMMAAVQGILNYQVPEETAGAKFTVQDSMNDTLRLIHRIRLDSDSLRNDLNVQNGSGLFEQSNHAQGIHTALKDIHIALAAVPIMAEEMRRMNISMGIMSYGMDSTMGRMGRMMPGGWW